MRWPATPAYVGRLGGAALLAATALLGTTTSTLGDPATACAKPKFDRELYEWCVNAVHDQQKRGVITYEEFDEALIDCCYASGGECEFSEGFHVCHCQDPPEDNEYPAPPVGQLPQIPGPTEATQAPPPPPPGNTAAQLPSLPPVQTG